MIWILPPIILTASVIWFLIVLKKCPTGDEVTHLEVNERGELVEYQTIELY